ncbi:cysteine hydrolase [Alcaligenaceae bacterium CGII-47]|nr:cysteine hydrolase [Alcaligenaceae bacterium CGII-47]
MSNLLSDTVRPSDMPQSPKSKQGPALTLQQQLTQQRCALLVIDMQNDFVADDGRLAKWGRDPVLVRGIIDQVNQLVEQARAAGQLIIWVATSHSFEEALPNYLSVYLRDVLEDQWTEDQLLVRTGSAGAQWHKDMTHPLPDEVQITKNMYSAFRGTRLKQILDAHGVRTLVLAGCNTNVCLHSTATDAFFDGYYPILCEDACATSSAEIHEAIIATHRNFYGLTATLGQIKALW